MTVQQYRRELKNKLENMLVEEADVITDILVAHSLGCDRSTLLLRNCEDMPSEAMGMVDNNVLKLISGTPIQYILGSCYFFGQEIFVGNGCFIPRSDTEILAQAALKALPEHGSFVDICSGSGCISAVLAEKKPKSVGYALELSYKALEYTHKNLDKYSNVTVRRFDALDEDDYYLLRELNVDGFDLLVSNPPYIPTDDLNLLSTQLHAEPELALDGGEDGLRYYREITRCADILLKPDGTLAFEIGVDQAEDVTAIMNAYGYAVVILKDYGDIERVVIGKRI